VGAEGIPREVEQLISEHINSIEQLEILLLLHRQPSRRWTAADVARELRIHAASAATRLADLAARGFLHAEAAPAPAYLYQPTASALDGAVGGLAAAYAERRVTVIGLIFSKPLDNIRVFAGAFRLKKDD
jgi:predicted ArsR family transcriptional regulator